MAKTDNNRSIEERVEDTAKSWLNSLGVKYWTKTESINDEIETALKKAPSKKGGSGTNYPDIKCWIDHRGRRMPVMIEVKGKKPDLIKLNDLGEVDNYKKDESPNYTNISKYAVNGAIHYSTAIVEYTESFKECVAVGITGWKNGNSVKTALKVYYVSDENYNVPKEVQGYDDLSFLTKKELENFIEEIDSLYLTEEEQEILTQKLEVQIETSLKNLNQKMRDTYSISETYRVKLISGMIIAGLGVSDSGDCQVAPLEIDELKSNEESKSHDGITIMNKISSYLECKDIPDEKIALIRTNFQQVFVQTDLWKQWGNGESRLKQVYTTVKKEIVPFFAKQKYHLDFTGKLFNVLNEWVKVPDGDRNDVVLTPRYVCDLMVKLCRVNMNSYVWDYAAGSGGFLVAAMKEMINDANKIEDKQERDSIINHIKMKQLLGIELRTDIYSLAVLNMFLMGDGSTHILNGDSLRNYSGKYEQGRDKDEKFPADVFLLNPPYSEKGKGFNFVKLAFSRMQGGYGAVLIQENAGSGEGAGFTRDILDSNTLIASIKMADVFCGRSSVKTAIYVFEVHKPHLANKLVKFIDFTTDGYTRQSRKKSNQEVNLRNTDNAAERYAEVIDIVLGCEPKTNYYTKDNGLFIEDVITTKDALIEPKKNLDRIHEKYDPLKTELEENKKTMKKLCNSLRKIKNAKKLDLEKKIKALEGQQKKIQTKISPIQEELQNAQACYDAIDAKIGADWTYSQHIQNDLKPTIEDFKKTVSDYLAWEVSNILKQERSDSKK